MNTEDRVAAVMFVTILVMVSIGGLVSLFFT
jgi:hypothetical protein